MSEGFEYPQTPEPFRAQYPSPSGQRVQLSKSEQKAANKAYQKTQHKGAAVTSLVTGIVGSTFGLIPILSIVSFPLAVVAVVFGLIARRRAMGKWGVVLGVLALVLAIISFVIIQRVVTDTGNCLDAVGNDLQNNTNTSDAVCNNN